MIEAHATHGNKRLQTEQCSGCGGAKQAPIATVLSIRHNPGDLGVTLTLCEECGRDVANAVGFMCIREGGWSKLEPRKRKPKAADKAR